MFCSLTFDSTNSSLYIHFSICVLCAAAEQSQNARKEVAEHLAAEKNEQAQIQVKHIIQEDYLVEATGILELHCDLLLAQFSLIQVTKWDLLNLHCSSGSNEWQDIPAT